MTAENAFLSAIIAHSDDDNPRLIYADWLDEQGKVDRAEFIRVQCELERLGPGRPTVFMRDSAIQPSNIIIKVNNTLWHRPFPHGHSLEAFVNALYWSGCELNLGDLFDVRCESNSGNRLEINDCFLEEVSVDLQTYSGNNFVRIRFRTDGPPDEHRAWREELRRRDKELMDGDEPSDIPRHELWFSPFGLITDFSDNCEWTYRRGFVDEISCPPITFLGGPCEKCGGIGQLPPTMEYPSRRKCSACRGTGHIEGYAKKILATTPLRSVRFTEGFANGADRQRPRPFGPDCRSKGLVPPMTKAEDMLKKEFPGIKFHID